MTHFQLTKFETICARVSLNIPDSLQWEWDKNLCTSLVIIDKIDTEMIFFPFTLEFDEKWDFSTIDQAPPRFYEYFSSKYGIMPGQTVFTSRQSGLILYSIWWPWGEDDKISLRVGIFSTDHGRFAEKQIKEHLIKWFKIHVNA